MGRIREPDRVSSWIFRIAYNLCMDHLKQHNRQIAYACEMKDIPQETTLLKQIEQHQMGACIREKMNQLPKSMRTILDLNDIMEFSHKEVAEILSITEENSKVKLHRARKELRSILNRECTLKYDERNIFICEPAQTSQSPDKKMDRETTLPTPGQIVKPNR